MVVIRICQRGQLAILQIAFLGCAVAVHGLQVCVRVGIPVQCGIGIQIGTGCLNAGKLILGQREAGGIGGVGHGIDGTGVFLGGIQEIICPGLAGLLVGNLLVQGSGHIEAEHSSIAAIVGVELIDSVHVEIIHFNAVDLVVTNGKGGGIFLPDTAVGNGLTDADTNRYHQQHRHYGDESDGVKAGLFGFLLSGELLFGQLGGFLLFTKLLLIGCAHVIKSSH